MGEDGWRLAAALLALLVGLGTGVLWLVLARRWRRDLARQRVPWAGRLVVGLAAAALGGR